MTVSNEDSKKRKLFYCVPGEVVILVDHPAGTLSTPEALLGALRQTQHERARQFLHELEFDLERTLTFDQSDADQPLLPLREQRTSFSLLFAHVVPRPHPDDIPDPALPKIVPIIEELNAYAASLGPGVTGDATLRAASPNWLITPFPQDAGGGSPGARPREVDPAMTTSTPAFSFPGSPSLLEDLQAAIQRDDVEVVILDTAPSGDQLAQAGTDFPANTLLQDLQANVQITYAGDLGIVFPQPPQDYWPKGHDYRMSDHGLFIAGIVRQLAPKAKIRIVEVLNEYGVGTLDSIGRGLKLVLDQRRERGNPVIVNCSFGMTTPLAGHRTMDLDGWPLFANRPVDIEQWHLFPERQAGKSRGQAANNSQTLNDWALGMRQVTLSLETISALSAAPNLRIVAAAGNDGNDPDTAHREALGIRRPQARYPAAFPTVIGVGAIDENGNSTSYSNLSDEPSFEGYATFGGAASSDMADETTGMLGVYIGEFPGRAGHAAARNTTGWAWWAGTSFAAPIISGLLANLAGAEDQNLSDAVERALAALETLRAGGTDVGPIIQVTQTP